MPAQTAYWIYGKKGELKMSFKFFRREKPMFKIKLFSYSWGGKKKSLPPIEHINTAFYPSENIKQVPIPAEWSVEDLKYHMIIKQHLFDLGSKGTDSLWEELDKYLTELKELKNGCNL